jgi:uncharacterized cupin superfamily protein
VPKVDIDAIPEENRTGYPPQFADLVAGRFRKRIARAGGLTQFGVNLCRLAPGAASSQRHWHEAEDELVFVLKGEATLIEDGGETILKPGDAATFKAGDQNGHHILNRSTSDVVILEVGTRSTKDSGEYPDIDLAFVAEGGAIRYLHKDGTPY